MPLIRLSVVDLPDPLGPIKPWIVPASTTMDALSTATTPPKVLPTPCNVKRLISSGRSRAESEMPVDGAALTTAHGACRLALWAQTTARAGAAGHKPSDTNPSDRAVPQAGM